MQSACLFEIACVSQHSHRRGIISRDGERSINYVHQNSPYSARIQPRFSPYSGHLQSKQYSQGTVTIVPAIHGRSHSLVLPAVGPLEVKKGHVIESCTAHCGQPSRPTALKMTPNDSSGSGLTFTYAI